MNPSKSLVSTFGARRVCVHAHTCMCICTYVYFHVCVCMHIYVHACIYRKKEEKRKKVKKGGRIN